MATTTYRAIRDNYVTLIEALTPSHQSHAKSIKFRRANTRTPLDDRVSTSNASSGIFRQFEIRRATGGEEAEFMSPSQVELLEEMVVAVAYPTLPELYGASGLDSMESVIEEDADALRDTITSAGNYLAGQNMAKVVGISIESTGDFWMLLISVELRYFKSQTLT